MPIVNIDLIAGRSQDQLKSLVKDVTDAVTKNTGAPAEHVHVILREMQKNRYGVAGILKSDEEAQSIQEVTKIGNFFFVWKDEDFANF